jgi:hypothetical protein
MIVSKKNELVSQNGRLLNYGNMELEDVTFV